MFAILGDPQKMRLKRQSKTLQKWRSQGKIKSCLGYSKFIGLLNDFTKKKFTVAKNHEYKKTVYIS